MGYFVFGPMKAVCLEDAPTKQAAARATEQYGTVIDVDEDVWPLVEGEDNPPGGPAVCVVCGRTILEAAD